MYMKKLFIFAALFTCCLFSYGAKKYYSNVQEGMLCSDLGKLNYLMSDRDIKQSFIQKKTIGIGNVYEDTATCTYWDVNNKTKPITGTIFNQRFVEDERYNAKMLHIDYLSVKKGVLNGYIEFYRAGKLEYRLKVNNGALVEGIHYRDNGCFEPLTSQELSELADKYTCGKIK